MVYLSETSMAYLSDTSMECLSDTSIASDMVIAVMNLVGNSKDSVFLMSPRTIR